MFNDLPTRIVWLVTLAALVTGVVAPPLAKGSDPAWPDQRRCGPFLCQANFPLAEIESPLRQLEALPRDLQARLGVPIPQGPVHVYLFADTASYRAYLSRYFPQVGYRRALSIRAQATAMVFVQLGPELAIDLRHEGTHALVQLAIPNMPLWLDEGLALYFERQKQGDGNQPDGGYVPRPAAELASLQDLERRTDWQQFSPADYTNSGVWGRRLLDGPADVRGELAAYLADLSRGPTPFAMSVRLQSLGKRGTW